MKNKTIVITRAKGDEAELQESLQEGGYHVIHEPLTEIFLNHHVRAELANRLIPEPNAIIITSKHGVQALSILTEIRDVFLLCVGKKTGEVAAQLGFSRVCVAGENVEQLIEYIMGAYDEDARFLYVSGTYISVDLGEALAAGGMAVERVVAYEAVAAESLSDTLMEQIRRGMVNAITFFSARTAQIFIALAQVAGILEDLNKVDAFCLSEHISDIVSEVAIWRSVYSAKTPTLDGLVDSIDSTYKNG